MLKEIESRKLYIKYMVCLRDRLNAKSELDKLGIEYGVTVHGAIEFHEGPTEDQFNQLKSRLSKFGLILLDDSESLLIDRIIHTIVEVIHHSESLPKVKFKDILTDHSAMSNESVLKIFSDVKGMSVLQFIVNQKIERMKELLLYEDQPLSEIANLLNYKSTQHMIAQFKKYTDLPPDYFKKLKKERNKIISQNSQDLHSKESISIGYSG